MTFDSQGKSFVVDRRHSVVRIHRAVLRRIDTNATPPFDTSVGSHRPAGKCQFVSIPVSQPQRAFCVHAEVGLPQIFNILRTPPVFNALPNLRQSPPERNGLIDFDPARRFFPIHIYIMAIRA